MSGHMRDIGSMLVAYCDHALSAEGRQWVEAQLATLPELRERLAAIEAVRAQLQGALPPAPEALTSARRDILRTHAMARHPRRSLRRRWLLAASLLIGVGGAVTLSAPLSMRRVEAQPVTDELAPVRVAYRETGDVSQPDGTSDHALKAQTSVHDRKVYLITGLPVPETAPVTNAAAPRAPPAPAAVPAPEVDDIVAGNPDPQRAAIIQKIRKPTPHHKGDTEDDGKQQARREQLVDQQRNEAPDGGSAGAKDLPSAVAVNLDTKLAEVEDDLNAKPTITGTLAGGRDAGGMGASVNALKDSAVAGDVDREHAIAPSSVAAPAGAVVADKQERLLTDQDIPTNERRDALIVEDLQSEEAEVSPPASAHPPAIEDDQELSLGKALQDLPVQPQSQHAQSGRMLRSRLVRNQDGIYARWLAALVSPDRDVRFPGILPAPVRARRMEVLAALLPDGSCSDQDLLDAARASGCMSTDAATGEAIAGLASGAPPCGHGGEPLGAALVAAARRCGLQVTLDGGGVALRAGAAALDPTVLGGWSPVQFSAAFGTAPLARIARDPVVTFAPVADTASFVQAQAALARSTLPDPRNIAIEQFINALAPAYPHASGGQTFTCYAEGGPAPFADGPLASRSALVALGIVTRAAAPGERRNVHLCIACDTSGSMGRAGGVVRARLVAGTIARSLGADDTLALVRFADQAEVALSPTSGGDQARIAAAMDSLDAHGATDVDEGIALAFQLAAEDDAPLAEKRVILLTDGATPSLEHRARILALIAACRARGIMLSVVGCGSSDREERALQQFADAAHASVAVLPNDAAAIDYAQRELVPAQLQVLARDTKVQVHWNPARVAYARLVGYEQHRLTTADFRNESVAAATIAPESQVTALFEVVLTDATSGSLGDAAVRCVDTRAGAVREQDFPIPGATLAADASPRLVTIACAAQLGELLGRTWWSNRALATWAGLERTLAAQPASEANRLMLTMAAQAQHLDGCP